MSEAQDETKPELLIGDIIRQAREKRNVSVKIVAQHTKISSTNLEALEANDLSSLPNKAYVKGYVKSCAKLLGLDEEECLDILQSNYDHIEKPTRIHEEKKQAKVKEDRENNELIFKMLGVVIVVIILVIVLSKQGENKNNADTSNNSVTSEKTQDASDIAPEEDKNLEITPVVLSNNTPMRKEATPAVVATPEATPTIAPTATPEVSKKKDEDKKDDSEKEKVELRPIRGVLYGFDSEMSKDQINSYIPENFRASAEDGKQNVFINATDGDTWLTYQTDGGEIKKFILKQGQKMLISGQEVLLFLGNYKVTKIFLNNKPLAISSRSGVKSLVFPQEKASEHFYPLFIYKDDGSVINSKSYHSASSN